MRFVAAGMLLLAYSAPLFAQSTVTFGASATSGNGSISTDLTWSTSPPLTTGTPCVAAGHPSWTGPKAGAGTQTGVVIATSGTLPLMLTCTFPGGSIATFTWTNPTTNTDGTAYSNPKNVRLKYTFNPTITASPTAASGEVVVDVSQTTPTTTRTVTGITQAGTMRGEAFAQNTQDVYSDPSSTVTKVFTGSFQVTQSVSITVNPKPSSPGALSLN